MVPSPFNDKAWSGSSFNFSQPEQPGTESRSTGPLEAGVYPARVVDSCYEETKTKVIVDAQKEFVRKIRDYQEGGGYTDSPITPQEEQSGCSVSSSGTYIYLRLGCDVEGLQWPRNVILRFNLENIISDPWSGRKLLRELGAAIGVTGDIPWPPFGQPMDILHDKPFLVELSVREKRGFSGKQENEADGFRALTSSPVVSVDVVSSGPRPAPPAAAFNDDDIAY